MGAPLQSGYERVGNYAEHVESVVGHQVVSDAYFGGQIDGLRQVWRDRTGTSFDTVVETMERFHDQDVAHAATKHIE
jgi:hypothetical protein